MGNDVLIDRITALVAPLLTDLHLELYDVEFRGGVLRITIDTPPGSPAGVDLEQIALITRLVSRDLDHTDPIPGRYTLEVTSPGLERTLRTATHFAREVGKVVAVRLRDVVAGERRLHGTLVAATDDTITVRLDDAPGGEPVERTVAIHQIDRARTVFVWGPAPKPGSAPKAPTSNTPHTATSPSSPGTPKPSTPGGARSSTSTKRLTGGKAAKAAKAAKRAKATAAGTPRPTPASDLADPSTTTTSQEAS